MSLAYVPHPKSLSEVTARWMSGALSSRHPGTAVTSIQPLHVINGTATKVRYGIEYAPSGNPHGLPASLWLKGGFEVHSAATAAGNRNEAHFFRDVAPRIDANCPLSYYQSICPETGEGLVLLEDLLLRDARFCELPQALSVDQVRAVLTMQANYHATFWQGMRPAQFPWLATGGFIVENGIVDYFFALWDDMVNLPRFRQVDSSLAFQREVLKRTVFAMLEINRDQACCLVHGDTHMGNLFIDGRGLPGYLDWQAVMRGHWAYDVAPLMVSALSVEQRRIHERELLAHYLDCLGRQGVDAPSLDEAWLRYRQFALWSFMFALCPPQFQSEENCTAVAERASAALLDLETLSAF